MEQLSLYDVDSGVTHTTKIETRSGDVVVRFGNSFTLCLSQGSARDLADALNAQCRVTRERTEGENR